jgi:hypothetical protein
VAAGVAERRDENRKIRAKRDRNKERGCASSTSRNRGAGAQGTGTATNEATSAVNELVDALPQPGPRPRRTRRLVTPTKPEARR